MRLLSVVLALAFLLAACAPSAVSQPAVPPLPSATTTNVPPAESASATPEEGTVAESTPLAAAPLPQAVPTSRGDSLVATDPALVNFNTGRPVLVEFFRFT
jgi:hypothetical protein